MSPVTDHPATVSAGADSPACVSADTASAGARSALTQEIFALFEQRGSDAYGESLSMTDHALQAAHFARADSAPDALVLAALLHDVGHLIEEVPKDIGQWTVDARHEETGGRWLAQRFPPAVWEPVRWHVPAKRYLCATDAGYFATLSAASVATLALQGGPMSADEVAQFERQPFHRDALCIRRWDDRGKVAGLRIAGLADYRPLIEALALAR